MNSPTPDTTTTTTALPASAEPLVITVANTTERRQMPLERIASVGTLFSQALTLASSSALLVCSLALASPDFRTIGAGLLAGGSLIAAGVRSSYRGKLTLTDAFLASAVVVGVTSASLQLTPEPPAPTVAAPTTVKRDLQQPPTQRGTKDV